MLKFPLNKYKIFGNSMSPAFSNGDYVLVWSWFRSFKKNDIVVARNKNGLIIIKRINNIKNGKYFLIGDNEKESTDSRDFGFITKKDILGKVFLKI